MSKQVSLWTTVFLFMALMMLQLPSKQRLLLMRPLAPLKQPLIDNLKHLI